MKEQSIESNQPKHDIRYYKTRFDSLERHYQKYAQFIGAILTDNKEEAKRILSSIKETEILTFGEETILTEDAYFDLSPRDINIYYNYGRKKIYELIKRFLYYAKKLDAIIENKELNKKYFYIWFNHEDIVHIEIPYKKSTDDFFKDMRTIMEIELHGFADNFGESYVLTETPENLYPEYSKSDETTEDIIPPPPPVNTISFKSDYQKQILEILEPYFPDQKGSLTKLIETGISETLTFNGNARTIADFFSELRKAQIFNVGNKKDLARWLNINIRYVNRGQVTEINFETTMKFLQSNGENKGRAAKPNRLINVEMVDDKWGIFPVKLENREQIKKY